MRRQGDMLKASKRIKTPLLCAVCMSLGETATQLKSTEAPVVTVLLEDSDKDASGELHTVCHTCGGGGGNAPRSLWGAPGAPRLCPGPPEPSSQARWLPACRRVVPMSHPDPRAQPFPL